MDYFCLAFCALPSILPPHRFHEPEEEMELNCNVVPYLDDNVQLSIEEYRGKLYEVRFSLHTSHPLESVHTDMGIRRAGSYSQV